MLPDVINVIIVVRVLLVELGQRVTDLLEESRSLPPDSWVLTAEHLDGPGLDILMNGVISVDPLVFLHHQNLRVHLRLFESVTAHLGLELGGCHWVDTFDVLEGGIDLLVFHLALIFHEVVRLLVKEFQPSIQHVQLLLCDVLFYGLEDIIGELVN